MIDHNGPGFDSYVVLNNLPQWRDVVNLIKNGAGIVSFEISAGYVDPVKKIHQYVPFRCERVLIISSFKKIGNS